MMDSDPTNSETHVNVMPNEIASQFLKNLKNAPGQKKEA